MNGKVKGKNPSVDRGASNNQTVNEKPSKPGVKSADENKTKSTTSVAVNTTQSEPKSQRCQCDYLGVGSISLLVINVFVLFAAFFVFPYLLYIEQKHQELSV
ncbi:hypothetical protein M3Y96_00463900 [Aphelenchoides besseyi]|nr:hypothetical protein M3Y96_00463900 [Aphelenchoides besseyi]